MGAAVWRKTLKAEGATRMEMFTTCIHCGTTFRVTHDQFRARSGRVLCGRRNYVCDGFQKLMTRDTVIPAAAGMQEPVSPSDAPDPNIVTATLVVEPTVPQPQVEAPPATAEVPTPPP